MRHFFFYPISTQPIQAHAVATGGRLGLSPDQISSNVLSSCPATEGPVELAVRFPEDRRELLTRYLQSQAAYYTPRVEETYGPALAGTIGKPSFVALSEPWRDFAASTVCFNMASDQCGMLIVFSEATVGADGQLLWDGKSGDLPPRDGTAFPFPVAPPRAATAGDRTSIVWKALADQLKFIGIGMTLVGGPASIFTALFSFVSTFLSPANTLVSQIVTSIETLLTRSNITTSINFATADIEVWTQWATNNFLETDFKLLTDPKTSKDSLEYRLALGRANNFIDKLHDAFMSPSVLFGAVTLMEGDPTVDPANLDVPNVAMLQFSPFLYFSSFILAMGKKAWLYSQQINGINDAKTTDLAYNVSAYSSQYTAYMSKVKAAIDQQIAQRSAMFSLTYDPANPRWYIADSYKGGNEQGSWPAAWGFQGGWGIYTCCGTSDCKSKHQDAQNGLNQLVSAYQNYFIGQIDSSGQGDLNAQVTQYVANDADIQALIKKNYPGGLTTTTQIRRA